MERVANQRRQNMSAIYCLGRFWHSAFPRLGATLLLALSWSSLAFCGEIQDAVLAGDIAKVQALIKGNPDLIFSKDSLGRTPLHEAASKGFKDMAILLIANKADVNAKSDVGDTPLHSAAANGSEDVTKLLLASKADVNARTNHGWTPLHNAVVNGYKSMVVLLLANKADVNAVNNDGWTPLHYAAWKSDEEIEALLLAYKADVNARANYSWTPLHSAAANGYKAAVSVLLSNGADVNARTSDGWTPADLVINKKDVAELLHQHGGKSPKSFYQPIPVNATTGSSDEKIKGPKTPADLILTAARNGDLAKVKLLLKDQPALISCRDSNAEEFNGGGTPLHWAAEKGYIEMAEFLLANGADVNARSNVGCTPLSLAADEGHKDIAELLLANKADVNARDYQGYMPLDGAAERNHKDIAELLLAKGADVNARNGCGSTTLHTAVSRGHKDIVELLLLNKVEVNAKDNDGSTPLFSAMRYKDVSELLLANGADVNVRNNDGDTVLGSLRYDDAGMEEFLMAHHADPHLNDKVGPGFAAVADYVSKPENGFENMSPSELQVTYRLAGVFSQLGYAPRDIDFPKWKQMMGDKSEDTYARLCAAYFLLGIDPGARMFVAEQLDSNDLRHRYNAARVLSMYLRRHPNSQAEMSLLLKHLANGSLDGSGVRSSPDGEFPEGDRDDIMQSPTMDIGFDLGAIKSKEAVPVLIKAVERKAAWSESAVEALAEIGDPAAIPVLLKVLKTNANTKVISALGRLKCKEAAPIIANYLTQTSVYPMEQDKRIIEALISIGDPHSITPLKTFLKQSHPDEDKAVARRALAQIDSPDPVSALSALFDREPDENEQRSILSDLSRYPDNPRVVEKLSLISETSGSAFMRRSSIYELGQVATKPALLELASLLDKKFPAQLIAKWGWKGPPPDFSIYFPHFAAETLRDATHQDFGVDSAKWTKWIVTSNE